VGAYVVGKYFSRKCANEKVAINNKEEQSKMQSYAALATRVSFLPLLFIKTGNYFQIQTMPT